MVRIGKSSLVRFAIVSYLISILFVIGLIKIYFHLTGMYDLIIGLLSVPTTIYYTFKVLKLKRAFIWRALNLSFRSIKRFLLSSILIVALLGYIGYCSVQINEVIFETSGKKTQRIYSTTKRFRTPRSKLRTSRYLR
jgi:hypothetical protein